MAEQSKFSAWLRNGRLATVALGIVFLTWLGFQIFASPLDRPPIIKDLLSTMAGIWITNIAFAQGKRDDKRDEKAEDSSSRIDELERVSAAELLEKLKRLERLERLAKETESGDP